MTCRARGGGSSEAAIYKSFRDLDTLARPPLSYGRRSKSESRFVRSDQIMGLIFGPAKSLD